jgi:F0F1-type ATP synthase membrane subunit b/b'
MLAINFYDPYLVIFGLLILAVLVFFWNKKNTSKNRDRRQRNFKSSYMERKREREEKEQAHKNNTGEDSRLHGNS